MTSSASGSPRSDAAPGLVGTELELPVVAGPDGAPPDRSVFDALWTECAGQGWTRADHGVSRSSATPGPSLTSTQAISTDTGPVLELATAPCATLSDVRAQFVELRDRAREALDRLGCAMLGCGVHPGLRPVPADYYRHRTPRAAYDYAVRERGWRHWSIVDKAAVQEIVDVGFEDAPRLLSTLHRLSGLMNFVLRNDPGVHARAGRRPSVRSLAWRMHVPRDGRFAGDAGKVVVPREVVRSWQDYLAIFWERAPMFLVGTKDRGHAYVPEHPSLLDFVRRAPADGWDARLLDGTPIRVRPDASHVTGSDWWYMGFARVRWKWRHPLPDAREIVAAWDAGRIEAFLASALEKVVVENRSTSAQPPGEELVSLGLIAGLAANLDAAERFADAAPYMLWRRLLEASTREPLTANVDGREVVALARDMIAIAEAGLTRRGEASPAAWLAPLHQRLADGVSPAERRLDELRRGGAAAMVAATRI